MTFSLTDKELFKKQIQETFSNLLDRGFSVSLVRSRDDSVLGEFLEITIENAAVSRGLRFQLMRHGEKEALVTFIEGKDKGHFLLDDFLKQRGITMGVKSKRNLSSQVGDCSDRLSAHLSDVRELIDEYFSEILQGKSWPIVSMDWAGYR